MTNVRDLVSRKLRRFGPMRAIYRAAFGSEGRSRRNMIARFYSQFLNPGDLIFDIGANIGVYAESLQSIGARVVAVEPNPECAQQIGWTTSTEWVTVVNAAVGDKIGTGKLFVNEANVLSSMSSEQVRAERRKAWVREIDVSVVTIDSLIDRYGMPRFIKLDVEGFEVEVLSGMSRQPEYLSFEFHGNNLAKVQACFEKLSPLSQYDFVIEEPTKLEIGRWVEQAELLNCLKQLRGLGVFGDVIAKVPKT